MIWFDLIWFGLAARPKLPIIHLTLVHVRHIAHTEWWFSNVKSSMKISESDFSVCTTCCSREVCFILPAGVLVHWLKLPAWTDIYRRFVPHTGIQISKKQIFIPRSLTKIQICGEPCWPRGSVRALFQIARAQISNYVSGKQYHLIHLTIHGRLSWTRIAFIILCGLIPHSFVLLCFTSASLSLAPHVPRLVCLGQRRKDSCS